MREVLSDIETRYPGLTRRIVTEDGALHRFVNLYVNDEDVRYLGSLETSCGRGRHDLRPPRRRRRLRLRSGGRFIRASPSPPIAVPAHSGHTKGTGKALPTPFRPGTLLSRWANAENNWGDEQGGQGSDEPVRGRVDGRCRGQESGRDRVPPGGAARWPSRSSSSSSEGPSTETRRSSSGIVEPERVVMFRVPWVDDRGDIQINRGYRVEMNSAIGPYKGGLRFHPSVYLGLLKFLAFEQVFKNALTTLPMGGGKGGSNFDPHGQERRRGHAVLPVVHDRAAAPHRPVHRRPRRRHRRGRPRDRLPVRPVQAHPATSSPACSPARASSWGGSLIRTEATGYGAVYFAQQMLDTRDDALEGKTCLVSGSGNVAQYTDREAATTSGAQAGHAVGLGRVHPRPGRHRQREARLGQGAEERAAAGASPSTPSTSRGDVHAARPAGRLQPAVGHPRRVRVPERHPERDQRARTRRTC